MDATNIMAIVLIVTAVIFVAVLLYTYVRNNTLDKIRADVYQLFLKAEHDPEVMASGKQKMKYVLTRVRSLLPNWIQFFITDAFLDKIVEGWFREIKDLLDDGKLNDSNMEDDLK